MKNNNQWAFIVNPVAGNGHSLLVEKELIAELKKRNIVAYIVRTERKNHAKTLVRELAEQGYKTIIAIGGDGTFNEAGSALIEFPEVTTGLIPAGTGNDFAQILGQNEKFTEKDWDIFFEAKTQKLDVGRCNGNMFFNGMGLGFDAQVASENYITPDQVKERSKNLYVWHILKNLLFYKERIFKTSTNGEMHKTLGFMNTISIGRRYAGDFFITPKAIANDGLLDVCMVGKLSLPQRLNILMKVPKGTHLDHKKVSYYTTDKMIIEVNKKSAYHLDGELFFDTRFEIDILPGKLSIIYNPKGNHFFGDSN
ncbi:MAG: diacylglycerol kinase family lipid kinase [Bacteroidales bacterium]|nr:diacylglycerol kinase family lipid kinase [Bacteroidales bacterium]MBN2820842.1 diacylglycerol kinase family lipid kinase [Bacteroidales bacterium]